VSTRAGPGAYALLTDGTTIEIRAARPEDFAAVRELHAKMSPDNLYLRFFSMSPTAAEQEARRVSRSRFPGRSAGPSCTTSSPAASPARYTRSTRLHPNCSASAARQTGSKVTTATVSDGETIRSR
jgi:hypothetical protein